MAQLKKPTIKNPDLVNAMADFKTAKNPETEKEMLEQVKQASFIAPIILKGKVEDVEPDEDGQRQLQASLMAVSNKQGMKMFPAFTDWLEFLKWKNDPDTDTMVVTFEQYCNLLLKQNIDINGIIINPAEASIVINKQKMAEMTGAQPVAPAQNAERHEIRALPGVQDVNSTAVEEAAKKFRDEKNADTQNALFRAMAQGQFISPIIMHNEIPKDVKPGDKVDIQAEFVMLKMDKESDQKILPIFTNISELQKWPNGPSVTAMPMTLQRYSAMLSDPKNTAIGVVINPFSNGVVVPKNQVQMIAPHLVLLQDKEVPEAMTNKLINYLENAGAVNEAYACGLNVNNEDGFLVAVELKEGIDPREVSGKVAELSKEFGACVVVPTEAPVGKKVKELKLPFFVGQ